MINRALVIVDVQSDFVEGGSLAVSGGLEVARRLADFLESDEAPPGLYYNLIVASKDWHIDPGPHWSDNPDYVDSWPVHCAANSDGAKFVGDWTWAVSYVVCKGQYEAAYSAFDAKTIHAKVDLRTLLLEFDVEEVDVVGLAYDYCVKATALDSVRAGFKTRILTDLTAPVHGDSVSLANLERELQVAGVELALSNA